MHEIEKTYFHIGNSGVTIKIIDDGFGPELCIKSGAFGNIENTFNVKLTPEDLIELTLMLASAAQKQCYSEVYCHAAQSDLKRLERFVCSDFSSYRDDPLQGLSETLKTLPIKIAKSQTKKASKKSFSKRLMKKSAVKEALGGYFKDESKK